jgi:hypothetical protein
MKRMLKLVDIVSSQFFSADNFLKYNLSEQISTFPHFYLGSRFPKVRRYVFEAVYFLSFISQ